MKIVAWLLAAALFGLAFAGCYTMLAHPTTEATWDSGVTARHCSDCHSSADYYYWHYPFYNTWNWRSPYWRSYYCDPWWWDDYWYWDDGGGGGTNYESPRYYGDRRSGPAPEPGLPGPGDIKVKDTAPQPPGGTDTGIDKGAQEKTKEDQGSRYHERRERPKPKEEPEKPEPKEKKAEDNQ